MTIAYKDSDKCTDTILEFIAKHEAAGNYNAVIGNSRASDDLGSRTIEEIYELMDERIADGQPSTAIGRYQIIRDTLQTLQARLGIASSAKFMPELQDRLGVELLVGRGYRRWRTGELSDEQFANRISMEWASLPDPKNDGKSHYDGVGPNRAGATLDEVYAMLALAKAGDGNNAAAEPAGLPAHVEDGTRYPGRIIRVGEKDASIVKAVKAQLNQSLGIANDPELRLDPNNPTFGPRMKQVIKLFQARHVDAEGQPLRQDGEIGEITWSALFGHETQVTIKVPTNDLLVEVLQFAAGEEAKKVREVPKNSNRGPEVDEYLQRAGVRTGLPWCCAFVYWSFDEAAKKLQRPNPMLKTAGCLDHWNRARSRGARRITRAQAMNDADVIKPGMIFVIDHGGGLGHTGLVEKVAGGILTTIEGNTDASRTREGGGVYRLTRKTKDINKGFIDYSGV